MTVPVRLITRRSVEAERLARRCPMAATSAGIGAATPPERSASRCAASSSLIARLTSRAPCEPTQAAMAGWPSSRSTEGRLENEAAAALPVEPPASPAPGRVRSPIA